MGVMVLYFAVAHWNTYFAALIYLRYTDKHPLQLVPVSYTHLYPSEAGTTVTGTPNASSTSGRLTSSRKTSS